MARVAHLPYTWRKSIIDDWRASLPDRAALDAEYFRWNVARKRTATPLEQQLKYKWNANQRATWDALEQKNIAAEKIFSPALQEKLTAAAIGLHEVMQLCGSAETSLSDAELKQAAELLADTCNSYRRILRGRSLKIQYDIAARVCAGVSVVPPKLKKRKPDYSPAIERLCCKYWWRRRLRIAQARHCEAVGIKLGHVNKKNAEYCSAVTMERWIERQVSGREWMEKTTTINEQGELFSLAQLADAGQANPANRRNELMTRIRGYEELAAQSGHIAEFVTLTCPSRMHAWIEKTGARNKYYDYTTPRQANDYLNKLWQRTRAAWARAGVRVYGLRVAEPHHDGCPHWHLLLFMEKDLSSGRAAMPRMRAILRRYALADSGREYGAKLHRCKFVSIDPAKGTAAGYVAKYVAKNLPALRPERFSAGAKFEFKKNLKNTPSVSDDASPDSANLRELKNVSADGQLFSGELKIEFEKSTDAVPDFAPVAWASTWGIRQFQFIGAVTATLWRTMRRVPDENIKTAPQSVQDAHSAANRHGDTKACWAAFVTAMGGVWVRRRDLALTLARAQPMHGRYGDPVAGKIIGLCLSFLRNMLYKCNTHSFRVVTSFRS